jgi:hypothetical protein
MAIDSTWAEFSVRKWFSCGIYLDGHMEINDTLRYDSTGKGKLFKVECYYPVQQVQGGVKNKVCGQFICSMAHSKVLQLL